MMNSKTPWENEPDEVIFRAHGLACVMKRSPLRHWCGYVGVKPSHPLYGVDFQDVVPYPDVWKERAADIDGHGVLNVFMHALKPDEIPTGFAPLSLVLSVHGGLSFSGHFGLLRHWWFFGFDCGHAGDLSPGFVHLLESTGFDSAHLRLIEGFRTYRTCDYVRHECITLAEQIAAYQVPAETMKKLQHLFTKEH
jgi:hypothetical protein